MVGDRINTTCYDKVVDVTNKYLGPAANRFIDRQIENHLHKLPEKLTAKDLLILTDWIKVAVSLLTEDKKIVEKYIKELKDIAKNCSPSLKKSKT